MKVLTATVLVLLVLSAVALDEAGKPRRRHRRRAKADDFRVRPVTWGGQKVVTVPKCDARAYGSTTVHAAKCKSTGTAGVVPAPTMTKAAPLNAPLTTAVARPILRSTAGGQQSAACTGRKGVCKSSGSCTGSVVRGLCPGPADWTCCVPKGTVTPPPPTSSDACLRTFNGATLASRAIQYQQHYASRGVKYSQASRQFGYDVTYADCTSFGYSVMEAAGYGCLFTNARYTAAMKPLMSARGGFHQVPKTGDIAMWGGHFGIVVQACAGGKVDMVAMGNSGCRRTGCITVGSLQAWGSGGWLGFWTPRAK